MSSSIRDQLAEILLNRSMTGKTKNAHDSSSLTHTDSVSGSIDTFLVSLIDPAGLYELKAEFSAQLVKATFTHDHRLPLWEQFQIERGANEARVWLNLIEDEFPEMGS
jgi:hypothetical protein